MISLRRRDETAFTLIEVLVAIGIIGTILGICGVCFAEIVRLRGAQDRYYGRLDAADYLLRKIERDVRAATGFAGSAGDFEAGERTLVLLTPAGSVVFHASEKGVERIERAADGERRDVLVPSKRLGVKFSFEGESPAEARSVATTVVWDEHPRIGVSRPTLSLRVALRQGGD